jgi:hypothetical protein
MAHETAQAPAPLEISGRVASMVDTLRKPFLGLVTSLTTVFETRDELAPKFMKAFDAFEDDTGGTFVDFVRLFDATVPLDRKGYKSHNTYTKADYLRRIVQQEERKDRKPLPVSKRPATPLVALARIVQTLNIEPAVWAAFIHEMHWSEKQGTRLRTLGAKLGPIPLSSRSVLRRTGTHG